MVSLLSVFFGKLASAVILPVQPEFFRKLYASLKSGFFLKIYIEELYAVRFGSLVSDAAYYPMVLMRAYGKRRRKKRHLEPRRSARCLPKSLAKAHLALYSALRLILETSHEIKIFAQLVTPLNEIY